MSRGVMPFRLLIDEAMRRLRAALPRVYAPFAVFFAVQAALLVFLQTAMVEGMETMGGGQTCATVLLYLLALALYGLGYLAMAVVAIDTVAGRRVSWIRVWSFPLEIKAIGTILISGVLLALSYLLCILPILYTVPLLSFVFAAMVEEGRFGTRAIERSARLVGMNPLVGFPKNPLIKIHVLTFVGMVLSSAASMVTQVPFEIARQVLVLRSAGEAEASFAFTSPAALTLQYAGAVLGALATTVVGLYSSFALALYYFDLRKRREGDDLEAELEVLEERRGLDGEPALPAGDLGG